MTLYTDVTSKHFKLKTTISKILLPPITFWIVFSIRCAISLYFNWPVAENKQKTNKYFYHKNTKWWPKATVDCIICIVIFLCVWDLHKFVELNCNCQILSAILSDVYQFVNWYSKYHIYGRSSSFCLKIKKKYCYLL